MHCTHNHLFNEHHIKFFTTHTHSHTLHCICIVCFQANKRLCCSAENFNFKDWKKKKKRKKKLFVRDKTRSICSTTAFISDEPSTFPLSFSNCGMEKKTNKKKRNHHQQQANNWNKIWRFFVRYLLLIVSILCDCHCYYWKWSLVQFCFEKCKWVCEFDRVLCRSETDKNVNVNMNLYEKVQSKQPFCDDSMQKKWFF